MPRKLKILLRLLQGYKIWGHVDLLWAYVEHVVSQTSPFELDFSGNLSLLLFDPTLAGLQSAGLLSTISPFFSTAFHGALININWLGQPEFLKW